MKQPSRPLPIPLSTPSSINEEKEKTDNKEKTDDKEKNDNKPQKIKHILKTKFDESTLDDVNMLMMQKKCTGTLSFILSIISGLMYACSAITATINISDPSYTNFGIATLVLNILASVCMGLSHTFSAKSKDKLNKLNDVVKQYGLNTYVINIEDTTPENKTNIDDKKIIV
jgi:hypothetical protein